MSTRRRTVLPLAALAFAAALAGGAPQARRGLRWLAADVGRLVIGTHQVEAPEAVAGAWRARVAASADPFVILGGFRIDARAEPILALEGEFADAESLQLFYAPASDDFSEARSVRVAGPPSGAGFRFVAIDLSRAPGWSGGITRLRLDLDGARVGASFRLIRVGAGPRGSARSAMALTAASSAGHSPAGDRRSAVHHDTVVASLDYMAASAVMTLPKDRFTYTDLDVMARILVRTPGGGPLRSGTPAASDAPGAVRSVFLYRGSRITTELTPLAIGRKTAAHDGAALFTLSSDPPVPLEVDCGGGAVEAPMAGVWPIGGETLEDSRDTATAEGGAATLRSPVHSRAVAVSPCAAGAVRRTAAGGGYLRIGAPAGRARFIVAYGADAPSALALARRNGLAERARVAAYYARLLRARIRTPLPELDAAFRTALVNLEYAWNEPWGWVESVNFWHALWHMQHTAAAEWIGQADRSRRCSLTQAESLMPDGAIPHLMTFAHQRRDFGGSNQFWAWQVRHYLQFTGDRDFARAIAPALDRVIAQTMAENDPDGNLLFGWGLQIGNQEDYIATPSDGTTPTVEVMNMLETRREAARLLGDGAAAAGCDRRLALMRSRLRDQLWLPDLGRFAFYRDPTGVARLDGQYHTLIYPGLWGITDAQDTWTSLRHMADRLTGPGGEVYCSNNFPNHVIATVGTQAGLAQQPWAAWGWAAAGQRDRAWRPLAAAAHWVMDPRHRGTWPEVASEPTPAYFSPPSGLYVASVVEALFGLRVDRPAGVLHVAPGLPDAWPSAELALPDYTADYSHSGSVWRFRVRSAAPLRRRLRWSMPPGGPVSLLADGRPLAYRLEPGVRCVFVCAETGAARDTRFELRWAPAISGLRAPGSAAEGEPIRVAIAGGRVTGIDDRCGALSVWRIVGREVRAQVRRGLLAPYAAYGALGRLTFMRRTFFVTCEGPGGATWWMPVDLTILPRVEAAQEGTATLNPDGGICIRLRLRGNTGREMAGSVRAEIAHVRLQADLRLSARSERVVQMRIPPAHAALLTAGSNACSVTLPGGDQAECRVTIDPALQAAAELRRHFADRLAPVALPAADTMADTEWRTLRPFRAYPHMPWAGSRPPLEALGDRGDLEGPGGLPFRFAPRRFVPVSFVSGRPAWSLPLGKRPVRKVYALVIPFLDNHDMYAPVGRLSLTDADGTVWARTLHFPGDLDWWSPAEVVGDFATARGVPTEGLLPIMAPGEADMAVGQPPLFPQTALWSSSRTVRLASSVLSVIEIDPGRTIEADRLTISTVGVQPGLAIVAVTIDTGAGGAQLDGTRWELPDEAAAPRALFAFDGPDPLRGWTLEGGAFSAAPFPALFSSTTLNSLAAAGEAATGRALSPVFTVGARDATLECDLQGGAAHPTPAGPSLALNLLDARTGAVLQTATPDSTPALNRKRFDLLTLRGRELRLELKDHSDRLSYAWIGLGRATLSRAGGRSLRWP